MYNIPTYLPLCLILRLRGKLLYVPKMNENHDIIGDYDAVPLEYAGFCPVALVSGQGFILPGNRRIGFLRFEGMLKKHTLI